MRCVLPTTGLRLSSHLVRNRSSDIRGSRILELGAGTGIVGITCAALGGHVTLTDLPDVVGSTVDNVDSNAGMIEQGGGSAQVAVLDWANPDVDVLVQPYDWVLGEWAQLQCCWLTAEGC
jgi:predicted RNA methylase